jgi:hypothetical protein
MFTDVPPRPGPDAGVTDEMMGAVAGGIELLPPQAESTSRRAAANDSSRGAVRFTAIS